MKGTIWHAIVFLLLAHIVNMEDPETDLEKGMNDVEDDPLMAPLNNDLDDEKPALVEGDAEFVPLPQMSDLFKDSESILKEEKSKVRQAIHQEELAAAAAEEEGGMVDNAELDMVAIQEEAKAEATLALGDEPIFNTDDFDDNYDDVEGNVPQGPVGRAQIRA